MIPFTAPNHPSTNGQAERYVQILKQKLPAMMDDPQPLNIKLCRLLMQHRKTPNSTTGKSLAELMFKRQFRTRVDLVKRNVDSETNESKLEPRSKTRSFQIGDLVQTRSYNGNSKWKFGAIVAKI
ncbi:hypothetical protein JTB14_035615 [Gonioctena quinquepunctata]|nr:hypothetical protein JTB14_035615 [Gonioctena quinquepunctata]